MNMIVKDFKSFFISETYQSFYEKMEEEYDYEQMAKNEISRIFDKDVTINDVDEFIDFIHRSVEIYESELAYLSLDNLLDLCLYNEETNPMCPETNWSGLSDVIAKNALIGVQKLVSNILSKNFTDSLRTFIEKNNLVGCDVSKSSSLDHFPPKREREIKDGVLTSYRNVEDEGNDYDVYQFRGLDTEIYITKKL